MSTSAPCNIPYMLELIAKNIILKTDISKIDFSKVAEGKPIAFPEFRILDVGCGFGKWAFMIRDTFDVGINQNFDRKDWKIDITGVEPFPKCITDIQKTLYNRIIQKDIFESSDELGRYDLAIMGDIIEHMDKTKAHELISEMFKHTENILISTPLGFLPQGPWAGNQLEVHKSGWKPADFKRYNVVEYKTFKDTLFSEMINSIPSLPPEMKKSFKLLVVWLKK